MEIFMIEPLSWFICKLVVQNSCSRANKMNEFNAILAGTLSGLSLDLIGIIVEYANYDNDSEAAARTEQLIKARQRRAQEMQQRKQVLEDAAKRYAVLALCALCIAVGVFFGVTYYDLTNQSPYRFGECRILARHDHLSRCCVKSPCACVSADCNSTYTYASCDRALAAQQALANCCDGPACCRVAYQTCFRQSCGGYQGNQCNIISYACDPYCGSGSTNSQQCAIACGTCHLLQIALDFDGSDYVFRNTTTQHYCGMDDIACVAAWQAEWAVTDSTNNSSTPTLPCWYDDQTIAFTTQAPPPWSYNQAAWASVIAFVVAACVCATCAAVTWFRRWSEPQPDQGCCFAGRIQFSRLL